MPRRAFAAVILLANVGVLALETVGEKTSVAVTVMCGSPGTLRVDLVDEATFGDPSRPLQRAERAIGEDELPCTVSTVFSGLAAGRYALRAFIDRNGDGRLNGGIFGPTESWALSWSDGPKRRIPRFEDIAFNAGPGVKEVNLRLTEGKKK